MRAGTAYPAARCYTGALGAGSSFGTFGELVQGVLPDGRGFLVTLPVAAWSTARFWPDSGPALKVLTPGKPKSARLANSLLAAFDLPPGGILDIASRLPVGKGMASSSADMVATARAISTVYGLDLSPEQIAVLLRDIEPTDGVMYDQVVAFYHREVQLRSCLGRLPQLIMVGVDEGGVVDTILFNQQPKAYTDEQTQEYEDILQRTECSVRKADLSTLGTLATRSAELNQRIRPKRFWRSMLRVCRQVDGLGLVAAHSGTKLGILIASSDPDRQWKVDRAVTCCREFTDRVTVDRTLCNADDWAGPVMAS